MIRRVLFVVIVLAVVAVVWRFYASPARPTRLCVTAPAERCVALEVPTTTGKKGR